MENSILYILSFQLYSGHLYIVFYLSSFSELVMDWETDVLSRYVQFLRDLWCCEIGGSYFFNTFPQSKFTQYYTALWHSLGLFSSLEFADYFTGPLTRCSLMEDVQYKWVVVFYIIAEECLASAITVVFLMSQWYFCGLPSVVFYR